jgi:hypothetical protein
VHIVSWRFLAFLLAAVSLFGAAKKTVAEAKGENRDLALTVTLYIDPAGVRDVLGADLDHFIVAAVTVEPKSGKEILIDRDDFQLRTDSDGEKAKPLAPSQIAGRGALIVTRAQGNTRLSGGSADGGYTGAVKATVGDAARDKDPLEQALKTRELPQVKTGQPASGLLYFAMEKQKMKDLELVYGGRENRIALRFK